MMGFSDILFAVSAAFWLGVIVYFVRNGSWWNS